MKRLILILSVICFGQNIIAQEFILDGIKYNVTSSTDPLEVEVIYNNYYGSVVIPSSVSYNNNIYNVTSIAYMAFINNEYLMSITIPNSVLKIGWYAFSGCTGLTSVSLGNGVRDIEFGAFSRCEGLSTITIPNSITKIGNGIFEDCIRLKTINLPNTITSIGDNTFINCDGLISFTVPKSVKSIGCYAFFRCDSLTTITISDSVSSIGINAFALCNSLTSINVDSGNSYYRSKNGVLFDYNYKVLVSYPGGLSGEYIVLDGVDTIGNSAFYFRYNLKKVALPNSLLYIDNSAFNHCDSLQSIIIGDSLIGFGSEALRSCSALTSITCNTIIPPSVSEFTFFNVNKSIPVYVPYESIPLYQTADGWKNFNILSVGIDDIKKDSISTKLYPNPCNGKAKLEIEGLSSEDDVLVYDMLGRVVLSYKINQGDKDLEIELTNHPKGVYTISIVNESVNLTKKLILQ